ncbi:MAG: magnesium-translocating P-type ATPase [Castellaniella sp.]|uniref:magnesium-translocating P-type ATPase n=1 Tax=Castellaniella sp. TaxID=1955812 RepID=UPI001204DD1C|nr:magnesium-translocating P-type ATPase [Castellaniella sp.]TAN31135.1 MAG: magnesium-translocating P-type ATPase [Castellaniella sp.]
MTQLTQSRNRRLHFLKRAQPSARDTQALRRTARYATEALPIVLGALDTRPDGLTMDQARSRLLHDGPNEVARDKPLHWSLQLLQAFYNPFVLVLLALAAISYLTGVEFAAPGDADYTGVAILMVMVTASGLLRFVQEFRSQQAAAQLKALVRTTATVLRRPEPSSPPVRQEVAMSDVVAGDIIALQAGDMIPADVRLLTSRDLYISQAALTGEALPIEKYDTLGAVAEKSAHDAASAGASPLDQPNVCYMGTNVVSGTATALVIATGASTYFGALARNVVSHKRVETSFDRGVNSVSWLLIRFMLVLVPVVFLINGLTKGDWLSALTFSLAVAVGLTPEMLPMIVSANLARGAVMMARRKVVVKRLNSVQNFGAMDVLCTDKTGTLTQDRIILDQYLDAAARPQAEILHLAWLNSHHQSGQRNLMDVAIISHASQAETFASSENYRKIDELPFDFVRRRLTVVLEGARGEHLLICKGAVDEMLDICTRVQQIDDTTLPMDAGQRAELLRIARTFNQDGFRVLIIATREIDPSEVRNQYAKEDEAGLTVRGFLTFLDPPKDSAAPALSALKEHGVAVKVLTGDDPVVTAKVCRQVGLNVGDPVRGQDIERLSDDELRDLVEQAAVFTKLMPLQKARVVKALQANGHTVGFLGDGINDAPALRDADVGISVDSGADIAKETADIILLEKDLMVLEAGVIKGRETFGNILKYLNMTASSNFGNVFSVLVASALLPWEPMLALQLLVLNLIYDLSQTLLPWDRMDPDFLKRPRKWDAYHIRRFMLWLGPTSSVFDITTFALMWFVFGAGTLYLSHGGSAGQAVLNSGWFIESLVSQTLVVHMLRTRRIPFVQSTAALPVLLSTATAVLVGCWLPFSPFAEAMGFTRLPGTFWFWLIATIAGYISLTQIIKTLYIRCYGRWF